MDSPPTFDPSLYLRAPSLTAGSAISLVDGLLQALPAGAPPLAKKTIKKLKNSRDRITTELAARRQGAASARSPQEIDQAADRAWRSVRGYLAAYLDLQPEFAPLQEEVRRLQSLLFGEGGLAFTTTSYTEQRAQMHHRLGALSQGNFLDLLRNVAGEPCEKNLLAAVAAYDEMVLGLLREVRLDDEKLLPLIREIQRDVASYARYISATVDEDEPETVLVATLALAPIDNLRRMTPPPRTSSPQEPTPPVTPPTPAP